MKLNPILAKERGDGSFDWLKTRFSFSFADWYDPKRMGFGVLRVLNDDEVAPGKGFGAHAHANFEIITIVLEGAVAHKDSTGSSGTVRADEVQVMTAGTGVTHAEINASDREPLRLFQIWIAPDKDGHAPRYAEKAFIPEARVNKWQCLVSGGDVPGSLMIHQDARIYRTKFTTGKARDFELKADGRGAFLMVIEGEVRIEGVTLGRRDAVEITETRSFTIEATADADVLVIDVPL